jgi:hypothetical protein
LRPAGKTGSSKRDWHSNAYLSQQSPGAKGRKRIGERHREDCPESGLLGKPFELMTSH